MSSYGSKEVFHDLFQDDDFYYVEDVYGPYGTDERPIPFHSQIAGDLEEITAFGYKYLSFPASSKPLRYLKDVVSILKDHRYDKNVSERTCVQVSRFDRLFLSITGKWRKHIDGANGALCFIVEIIDELELDLSFRKGWRYDWEQIRKNHP